MRERLGDLGKQAGGEYIVKLQNLCKKLALGSDTTCLLKLAQTNLELLLGL